MLRWRLRVERAWSGPGAGLERAWARVKAALLKGDIVRLFNVDAPLFCNIHGQLTNTMKPMERSHRLRRAARRV